MTASLSIVLPLVMAVVMIVSGIAKLRRPDDLNGWANMGVPAVLRRPWLLRLHPWGELALGAALAVLGGVLGLLAALVSVGLMTSYTVLVARSLRSSPGAECSCFGAPRPVTRITVVRNVWLLVVAVGATAVIWVNPLLGGALAAVDGADWGWVLGAAVAAVTAMVILWPDGDAEIVGAASLTAQTGQIEDGEELDYIRVRTPAVPVTLADGTTANLRELAATRPILVLAVSETCGSCTPVIEKKAEWAAMLPEVDIRFLSRLAPEDGGKLTERTTPQSLHDPNDYVRGSIADWPTPTAVLLGADGMLAGGPVSGFDNISQFVEDVYESLHDERPPA
ncbi:MauE/DoxX family redox-associated membrane protein [Microbacterium sp.]|uniref:MauE/DoxX family redox-associated membrane protein n=1 Tax=Microbacterium sp. TaxID=51671 RepID=UPI0025FCAE66|nr:MauE/DoxX family redox-associated membrane protein [Microbacterium sp.]